MTGLWAIYHLNAWELNCSALPRGKTWLYMLTNISGVSCPEGHSRLKPEYQSWITLLCLHLSINVIWPLLYSCQTLCSAIKNLLSLNKVSLSLICFPFCQTIIIKTFSKCHKNLKHERNFHQNWVAQVASEMWDTSKLLKHVYLSLGLSTHWWWKLYLLRTLFANLTF